jgi:hypothetical protein
VNLDAEVRARLRHLASFAEVVDSPDFVFGQWVPMEQQSDGVYTMPWFDFSRAGRDLIGAMIVSPEVNWPTWVTTDEAQRLLADPAAVAHATVDQLVALMTALVRGDRFNEGLLARHFETGHLRAIVRRAAQLV